MSDGFDLLARASSDPSNDSNANGGSDFLSRFGAIDISGNGSGDAGSSGGNSGGSSGDDFDPAIHISRDRRNADGSYTRKRGRKSGAANSRSGNQSSGGKAGVKAIQNSLEGIHATLALFTGFDDLRLSEDESEPLAGAIAEVGKHYDVPALNPKYVALFGLAAIAGKVYAPKIALVKMQLDDKKKEKREGKILQFPNRSPFVAQKSVETEQPQNPEFVPNLITDTVPLEESTQF